MQFNVAALDALLFLPAMGCSQRQEAREALPGSQAHDAVTGIWDRAAQHGPQRIAWPDAGTKNPNGTARR